MSFDLLRLLQVVVGIGLIVFVHELGHFLAARLCGVRVATFSLGYGPAIWSRRIGQTDFQVAPIPIGGFCRMAGEERRFDGTTPLPDELLAQGVGKRFFIYSGGVLANILFVLAVYPFLFAAGVPFQSPVIGSVTPGSAAWHAGLEPGMEVVALNGKSVYEFSQIPMEVIFGAGEPLVCELRAPGTEDTFVRTVQPRYDERLERWTIGVGPAVASDEGGAPRLEVRPGGPAERAGLRTGMSLLGVAGAPARLTPLEQFDRAALDSGEVALRVRDGEEIRTVTVAPEWLEGGAPRLGIRPVETRVLGVREGSLAERAGLREGDRILRAGDRPVIRVTDLEEALSETPVGEGLTLHLSRDGEELDLTLPPTVPGPGSEEFLAGLALGSDLDGTRVSVQPGEAGARAGLRDGDRILELNGVAVDRWEQVFDLVREAGRTEGRISIQVERRSPTGEVSYPLLQATLEAAPVPDYGIAFRQAQYTFQADGAVQAVRFGVRNFVDTLGSLWLALQAIVRGSVKASDGIGGPVAIVQVSYAVTGAGWARFVFFLCFISLNLAVVNLLPIPALDGGHLIFLIIEKLKGSPVSDRVLGYSQMVGVVLLLSLMIFATYNDILRLFAP